ncbi:MAG: hypothetical protein KF683_07590 [Rubrivivax sp.]|nr:hypothetical protein [Rubrivivax sp.]
MNAADAADAAGWAARLAERLEVWASYRPSDLLMYSPATWWRLVERANGELWPLPVVLLLAGLASGAMLAWRPRGRGVVAAAAVVAALAWAVVALAFHAQRFAGIHWAAGGFAVAFALQALLWLAAARSLQPVAGRGLRRAAGLAALAFALAGWPLAGVLAGRPWGQAEVFGIAPDPTALAALGTLLLVQGRGERRPRWTRLLWLLPLAWCAWSALMRWTMGDALAWPLAAVVLLAPPFAALGSRR